MKQQLNWDLSSTLVQGLGLAIFSPGQMQKKKALLAWYQFTVLSFALSQAVRVRTCSVPFAYRASNLYIELGSSPGCLSDMGTYNKKITLLQSITI